MRKTLARLGKALTATPQALEAFQAVGSSFFAFPRSAYVDGAYLQAQQASHAVVYATQPNVRLVVDRIAETAAARSLKLYERRANGDRDEDSGHPAAATMREPNDWQGTRELLETLIRDFLLYDNAYLWDFGAELDGKRFLVRVPPFAMAVRQANRLKPSGYRVLFTDGAFVDLAPEEVVHWRGYSATDNRTGSSKMETLRSLLVEESVRQAQTIEFVRGGMVKGGIVTRPLEAPEWSSAARERFEESWASRLKGVNAGKSPVLEEGMLFVDAGVTPKEAEAVASRVLNLATISRVFGVHPAVFGLEGDLEAAREAMEEDLVVPLMARLAETLTRQLVGTIYGDTKRRFFEFSRRQSPDLLELYEAGNKATGGPVVTVNEFRRSVLNLPPIDGGDELLSQANTVRAGGPQPSPTEMAPGDLSDRGRPDGSEDGPGVDRSAPKAFSPRQDRAVTRRDEYAAEHAELFRAHFRRQLAAEGGKALDDERWDRELAADLRALAQRTVEAEGALQAARLMGTFDPKQVRNYLNAGARAAAKSINGVTADLVRAARLADSDDPTTEVLTRSVAERADKLGIGRATALTSFAAHEAARQNTRPGSPRVKTWVGSGLPNSRHVDVSGETVPVGQPFSNGMLYPGDPDGSAEETAGCQCTLDVA